MQNIIKISAVVDELLC